MPALIFQPYVGPTYRQSPVRVLILGESHYGKPIDNLDEAEATRYVVNQWLTRVWAVRYLTTAARLLTGLEARKIDRHQALSPVAFYNFIQAMMPDISVRPTPEQARASWAAFQEVLDDLDPTHVLATGRGYLWSNMPPGSKADAQMQCGGMSLPYREYVTPSGAARTVALPHLSRAPTSQLLAPVTQFLLSSPLSVRAAV